MKLRWSILIIVISAVISLGSGVLIRFFNEPASWAFVAEENSNLANKQIFFPSSFSTSTKPLILSAILLPAVPPFNFCASDVDLAEPGDFYFCQKTPKIKSLLDNGGTERALEIDLTKMKALLYKEEKLVRTLNVVSKAPPGRWYQPPTGYFRAGEQYENHPSSLFPVYMPYSTQYHEDFFIHGIPYYASNNEKVPPGFSGGCLRLEDEDAKIIFDFLKKNDPIVVYESLDDFKIKSDLISPIPLDRAWIRQSFNSPLRQLYSYSLSGRSQDYYHHTGIDLAPERENTSVVAVMKGKVAKIQPNDGYDHGMGNTVIMEHFDWRSGEKIYSLYAHLASIKESLAVGDEVEKGEIIGQVGNSADGCNNYWRIGTDGCENQNPPDIHLHFEIKKAPVLENPEGDKACVSHGGPQRFCYGYTPDNPKLYGYLDPLEFLKANDNQITLLFAGDIMLDRGVNQITQKYGGGDYDFPFLKMADVLKSADLTFGNLEGPVSNKGQNMGNTYSFRMSPQNIDGLKSAGFGVLSLANNHIGDWGKEALSDTILNLENAGIAPIGAGFNQEEAYQSKIMDIKGVKIAFLAFSDFNSYLEAKEQGVGIAIAGNDKIRSAVKEANEKADLVIVSFHFGEEYQKWPNLRQEELAQLAIDSGADLVVGHHPHIVQSLKEYKGKYIAYSLGNFIFDQGFSKDTMRGGLLKVEIGSFNKNITSIKFYQICLNKYFQPDFCEEQLISSND